MRRLLRGNVVDPALSHAAPFADPAAAETAVAIVKKDRPANIGFHFRFHEFFRGIIANYQLIMGLG